MPYTVDSPPERLKGKGIPAKYIRMFVHVFNSVYDRTKDEGKAWKAGYKVMGEALRKAGYTRDSDGKWHKEEAVVTASEEEHMGDELLATSQRFTVLEELGDGTLTFEGVALVDNILSENKRFYSAAFNDRCMEATNRVIESRGLKVVTMFSRHGKALGGFGTLPTGLPVGKVLMLFREANEIKYKGMLVPTTEGKDMMTLIKNDVMLGTSIRSNEYESRPREFEGATVQDMVSATLAGIDFTDNPGIEGAGVRRIFEEAPQWEEENMDWEKVTLEELLENAKPLMDEYAATMVEATQEQVASVAEASLEQAATLQEQVDALGQKVTLLVEEKEALVEGQSVVAAKAAGLELKLALAEAAHIGKMAKMVYAELSEGVTSVDQLPEKLAGARDKAMMLVLSSIGEGEAKGQASFEDAEGDGEDEEPQMTEEAKKILDLAA